MAGKATAIASEWLNEVFDVLSKNCLIDLAVDMARGELGEDATDEAVVEFIATRISPVLAARKDRAPNWAQQQAKATRIVAARKVFASRHKLIPVT